MDRIENMETVLLGRSDDFMLELHVSINEWMNERTEKMKRNPKKRQTNKTGKLEFKIRLRYMWDWLYFLTEKIDSNIVTNFKIDRKTSFMFDQQWKIC